jgi:hypothetical protein
MHSWLMTAMQVLLVLMVPHLMVVLPFQWGAGLMALLLWLECVTW